MRVVILGGTGFIGAALTQMLAKRGDSVRIPSRSAGATSLVWTDSASGDDKDASRTHTVNRVPWDGKAPDALAALLDGADAVVNLLGENIAARRWSDAQKTRIVSSRVQAGAALTAAFARLAVRPRVLIQASASGWYGSWPEWDTAPICTEASPAGDNFLAQTAVQWEASTVAISQTYPDVRRCIIRTAPVLGAVAPLPARTPAHAGQTVPGGMLARLVPLFRAGLGGPVGTGRQPFAWIHLMDEVAAICFLLDHDTLDGPFNLCAPETVTMGAFARALGQALHRPAWLRAPAFALRLALGQMADELLLSGQHVVPTRLEQAGFVFGWPTLAGALGQIVRP